MPRSRKSQSRDRRSHEGSSIHTDMRNVLQEADDDPSVEDMDSWYEETMYDESVEFLAREAQERLQLSKLERACIGVSEAIAVALSFRDMMISTCVPSTKNVVSRVFTHGNDGASSHQVSTIASSCDAATSVVSQVSSRQTSASRASWLRTVARRAHAEALDVGSSATFTPKDTVEATERVGNINRTCHCDHT